MKENKTKKSNWGIGIALLYGGFVVFILSVVIFSTMQDFALVEDNYYQKSLVYQNKIDMMNNTANLTIKPRVIVDANENLLTIKFPDSLAKTGINGTAHFFRPSDKRADQIIEISLNENSEMIIPTTRFLKGFWILKLSWESSQLSFYQEENLTL